MSRTSIEWTDETWNPVRGCSRVSAGCDHCYAMGQARRFDHPGGPYEGLTRSGTRGVDWSGRVRLVPQVLKAPFRWRKPRRVFVNSMSDLFHTMVPDLFIDRVFAVMMIADRHHFQVLTKRPDRMLSYVRDLDWSAGGHPSYGNAAVARSMYLAGHVELPLPNVWLGVSCEDQATADERIPLLLQTPAAVRFVSCEPLLGPIDLSRYLFASGADGEPAPRNEPPLPCLHWVIVGGESGPKARPMHPDWARSLRDQCVAAGVPFLFKQWGEWGPGEAVDEPRERPTATWFDGRWILGRDDPQSSQHEHRDDEPDMFRVGKKSAGRVLDGRTWDEFPDAVTA